MNLNYAKRDGSKLTPSLVLVDSGDQTDMVYDFCADTSDYTLPAKGASRKLETDYKYSVINKAGSKACGINLVIIDTAKYKDRIAARLRRENGTGSWMVFSGIDGEYAGQVTAEHKISERQANGAAVQKWVKRAATVTTITWMQRCTAMAAADIRGARSWHLERYEPPAKQPEVSGSEEQWIQTNELEGWL
ncbi:MAG: terminase gpA endonuclease subunit [Eisenbergiella sp.]